MDGAVKVDADAGWNMKDNEFLRGNEFGDLRFKNTVEAGENEMKRAAFCDRSKRFSNVVRTDRCAIDVKAGEFFEKARGIAKGLYANAAFFVQILKIDLVPGFDSGLRDRTSGANARFDMRARFLAKYKKRGAPSEFFFERFHHKAGAFGAAFPMNLFVGIARLHRANAGEFLAGSDAPGAGVTSAEHRIQAAHLGNGRFVKFRENENFRLGFGVAHRFDEAEWIERNEPGVGERIHAPFVKDVTRRNCGGFFGGNLSGVQPDAIARFDGNQTGAAFAQVGELPRFARSGTFFDENPIVNAKTNVANRTQRADGIDKQTAANQPNEPDEKAGLGGDGCKLHHHNDQQKDFPGACQTEHSLLSAKIGAGKLIKSALANR